VYVAGAAAYVTKCQQVEATRAEWGNCTAEVPVMINGTIRFADPFTWVVNDYPTVLPCSDVMPVRWRIKEHWYCASPRAQICSAPSQLETTATGFQDEDFTIGLGHGIFTTTQLEQHKQFQRAQASRGPVLQKITNSATGNVGSDGQLGMTLSVGDVDSLKYEIGGFLFPLFPLLGNFWTIASGVFLSLVVVKVLISCVLRGIILYMDRGCGFWLFGAIWSTLFTVLRTPGALAQAAIASLRQPLPGNAPKPDELVSYAELQEKVKAEKEALEQAGAVDVAKQIAALEDGRPRIFTP
jgi:hypothetical protein